MHKFSYEKENKISWPGDIARDWLLFSSSSSELSKPKITKKYSDS
jgi:hypothetical protein